MSNPPWAEGSWMRRQKPHPPPSPPTRTDLTATAEALLSLTRSFREEQPRVPMWASPHVCDTNLVPHRQTQGLPMTGGHTAFQPTRQGTDVCAMSMCVRSCLEKPLSLHGKVTRVPYPSTLFRSYFWKNVESPNSNKGKILAQPTQTCVWNMLQKNRNVCEFEIPAPELKALPIAGLRGKG